MKILKNKKTWLGLSALCLLALPVSAVMADPPVQLDNYGSTTLQPIAEACETDFETYNPGIDLVVSGGGSSYGIRGLTNYRGLYPSWPSGNEVASASSLADPAKHQTTGTYLVSDLHLTVIGRDAVCIAVKDDPAMAFLTNITKGQLDYIYEREGAITTTTWADVDLVDGVNDGWPARNVVPRARITDSGTRATFLELVGITEAKELNTIAATGQPRLDGNQDMCNTLAANTDHIGYIGLGYITQPGIRVIPVGGVTPSEATVNDGTYPLSRTLNMYTLNPGVDPTYETYRAEINAYLNFMLGPMGQAAVKDEGFIPVQPAAPDWDVNGDHGCNVGDIVAIGLHWMESVPIHPVHGTPWPNWTRSNANNDLTGVNVGDIVFVGNYWQQSW